MIAANIPIRALRLRTDILPSIVTEMAPETMPLFLSIFLPQPRNRKVFTDFELFLFTNAVALPIFIRQHFWTYVMYMGQQDVETSAFGLRKVHPSSFAVLLVPLFHLR